ncbi:MAG TPA: M23 family metallopeptidase, partial [Patescibacteria group bacterium]|nr:M23 family metallopeptidase [Patescibacteria group bacterium]
MAHDEHEFGDLNPATHPQTGRSLDPDSFSGISNLAEAAQRVNRPSFLDKLGFPLKGIVLRVESDDTPSWIERMLGVDKVHIVKCRVRIPELHSHLPIPETYGAGGLNSIMMMYPIFVAQSTTIEPPVPADLCYVDFLDRNRFEDPIYLGTITSSPKNGAGSTARHGEEVSKEVSLESSAPPGDPIGQSLTPDPNGQTPIDGPLNERSGQPAPRDSGLPLGPGFLSQPYLMPLRNTIVTSNFGRVRTLADKNGDKKKTAPHKGMDTISSDATVYSPVDGTITNIQRLNKWNGNAVSIRDRDGYTSKFIHLDRFLITLTVGQKVRRGQKIAVFGNTGASKGAHLHWQLMDAKNNIIDPMTSVVGTFTAREGRSGEGLAKTSGSSTDYPN